MLKSKVGMFLLGLGFRFRVQGSTWRFMELHNCGYSYLISLVALSSIVISGTIVLSGQSGRSRQQHHKDHSSESSKQANVLT